MRPWRHRAWACGERGAQPHDSLAHMAVHRTQAHPARAAGTLTFHSFVCPSDPPTKRQPTIARLGNAHLQPRPSMPVHEFMPERQSHGALPLVGDNLHASRTPPQRLMLATMQQARSRDQETAGTAQASSGALPGRAALGGGRALAPGTHGNRSQRICADPVLKKTLNHRLWRALGAATSRGSGNVV